jgi:hypothetical protein
MGIFDLKAYTFIIKVGDSCGKKGGAIYGLTMACHASDATPPIVSC